MYQPAMNQPAMSRRYVAHGPAMGSSWAGKWVAMFKNPFIGFFVMIGVVAVMYVVIFIPMMAAEHGVIGSQRGESADIIDRVFRYGFVGLILVGAYGVYRWSQRRKIYIDVADDVLTASNRRGDAYSLRDAKLGVWGVTNGMTMGSALHLHSGGHRFVLGGKDYRVAAGTPLEAPDVGYGQKMDVNAWVSGSDFAEILAVVSQQGGVAVRAPAPGQPTRCLLMPNPMLVQQMGSFAFRKRQQLMQSVNQARMAIDVGDNEMRFVDPSSNAVIASAPLAQVTATPGTYQYRMGWRGGFSAEAMLSRGMASAMSVTPELAISVPGMQPLRIACHDSMGGFQRRYSWRGDVPQNVNDPAEFAVSGADWMLLVSKLGLAPYLDARQN
jgi:hypothetical protein